MSKVEKSKSDPKKPKNATRKKAKKGTTSVNPRHVGSDFIQEDLEHAAAREKANVAIGLGAPPVTSSRSARRKLLEEKDREFVEAKAAEDLRDALARLVETQKNLKSVQSERDAETRRARELEVIVDRFKVARDAALAEATELEKQLDQARRDETRTPPAICTLAEPDVCASMTEDVCASTNDPLVPTDTDSELPDDDTDLLGAFDSEAVLRLLTLDEEIRKQVAARLHANRARVRRPRM